MHESFPTDEVVERIVQAVGSEPLHGRDRLKSELQFLLRRFQDYRSLDASSRRKAFDELKLVKASAERLKSYFSDPDRGQHLRNLLQDAAREYGRCRGERAGQPFGYPDLGLEPEEWEAIEEEEQEPVIELEVHADEAVARAISAAGLLLQWSRIAFERDKPQKHDRSPEVRLVGHMLPTLLSEQFGLNFSVNNTAAGLTGTGLRFARVVLQEASLAGIEGLNLSDETVRAYLKSARKGQLRRSSN